MSKVTDIIADVARIDSIESTADASAPQATTYTKTEVDTELANLPMTGSKDFIASGAIDDGKVVYLNSDGTVSMVSGNPEAIGTATVFESAVSTEISTAFDSLNNKVVIAYKDSGNFSRGTVIVGAVSGNTISFGTPVVFNTRSTSYTSVAFDTLNNKVVIVCRDFGTYSYGKAVVGTISGTSISLGTAVNFSETDCNYISATFDSLSNKVVIAYKDLGNSNFGTAVVGTVSGTSISFGTPVVFTTSSLQYVSATFDTLNNKVIIAYQDSTNSNYGTAVVGIVSDTSISFGTPTVFNSAATYYISATFDSTNNKVVIAYRDGGNSSRGTAIVCVILGTSISFGTPTVFDTGFCNYISSTFDSLNHKVVISYQNGSNSSYGTTVVGEVINTYISFNTPAVFASTSSSLVSTVFDTFNNKVIIAYADVGNSTFGTSVVYQLEGSSAGSYTIGIANSTVADTESVNIDILAGTNASQTGLTIGDTYYVDVDGTITNIDSGYGVIGKALSATELLITKGV